MITVAALALSGCGGGGGGGGGGSGVVRPLDNLTEAEQEYRMERSSVAASATPNRGSVTQSSNVNSGVTTDAVDITVTYGERQNSYMITVTDEDDSTISFGSSDAALNTSYPIVENARDLGFKGSGLRFDGDDGDLYVDIYSDIEAPEQQLGAGNDGTVDVSAGTLVATSGVSLSVGGSTSFGGTLDGQSGTFSCAASCAYVNGRTTAGAWMFTPDRPPGSTDISGVSGVVFTGRFDTDRTVGTYNGQSGYFRCLSDLCGRGTSNGRLSSLTGNWIFVPATIVRTTPDTDYLAGGIWLYIPNDAESASDVTVGAFADGSDPFTQANIAGLTGTATYDGVATGVYTDVSEIRYVDALATLTANFGNSSALGTINGRIHTVTEDGNAVTGDPVLTLGTANIGSAGSGFFTGATSMTFDGSAFTGRWGGQFYSNGDSATDHPGSVAGTFGAGAADDSASLLGAFGAHRQ